MVNHGIADDRQQRPSPPPRKSWLLVTIALAALVAAGFYLYWQRASEIPVTLPEGSAGPQAASRVPSVIAGTAEPAIRHPLPALESASGEHTALPALENSDEILQNLLTNLFGPQALTKLFNPNHLVRNFVVTVDNLPRENVNRELSPFRSADRTMLTAESGGTTVIASANYARYDAWIAAAEAIDTKKLVTLYVRFYPWLQQEYRTIGYPNGAFNDRVVQVIDDLIAAPDIQGPLAVTQSKVLYEFADPDLESLSAGRKILLRMGPENAARLKTKLRDIRRVLLSPVANP